MYGELAWTSLFRDPLAFAGQDVAALLDAQLRHEQAAVNMVASETYCPLSTLEAEASILVNLNASGYPAQRVVTGTELIDRIERLAISRAKGLFGAEHANVQPLSSSIANLAVLRGLLSPGDRILSFDRTAGGHVTHGGHAHASGQDYDVSWFGVDEHAGTIDLAMAERMARQIRPKMIIAGSANYPRRIDFGALHRIAAESGALLFADIAHVAGLVATGLHPNPTPYADVVATCTHKTLCGPRTGGLILCRETYRDAIDSAVYPGIQGAPGAHIIAARAVLFDLVSRPAFTQLMRQVVANANALADALRDAGVDLYMGGTDTHMVVIDLRRSHTNGQELSRHLAAHGVTANSTTLPALPDATHRSGLRIGSVPMTIRGTNASAFQEIGRLIAELISSAPQLSRNDRVAARLFSLAHEYPLLDDIAYLRA